MRHAIAMVIVSAGAMIVEIVAARMLAPLVGMTVFSWTAVIATVLAGLSVGHWIGGRLADGEPAPVARRLFWTLAATAAVTATPVLLVEPVHRAAEAAGLGWMAATVAIAGLCFLVPSLLAGAVTPILTAAAVAEAPARPGAVIGRMFALGAGGAIVGTTLAGFVLLQWVGSVGSLALVAIAEAMVAALYLRGNASRAAAVLVVVAGQGLTLGASPYCRVESRYYCLDEVDTSVWTGFPSRGMFLDGWIQSIEPLDGSDRLAIEAHAFLDAWARGRHRPDDIWNAFFIGGGGYSLPMRWLDRWPGLSATVAEIDPAVTAFALEIGFRRPDDRVHVRDDDARSVLRRDEMRYDLVFSDAFTGHTMPAHLVTVEFHRLVGERLNGGGVYAINTYDWAQHPRFLAAMVRSLRQVFPAVAVWASGAGPVRSGSRTPYIVLASMSPLDHAPVAEPGGDGRVWVVRERLPGVDGAPVLTDDYAPVDRLTLR